MAGIDPKKQLLSLIRDCASERTQGERRVVGLKNRIEELRAQLEGENAQKEESKRFKETTEQELKGCEVELAMDVASIHTLEARISQIQDQISCTGSEVERLKNEERASRDQFISQMFELNHRIREFQVTLTSRLLEEDSVMTPAEADNQVEKEALSEPDSGALEDLLAELVSRTNKEQEEYKAEKNLHDQLQQEYSDLQKKVSLIEAIMKEAKGLEDLTKQTSELEQACASLGEELQKRCVCPSCCAFNAEFLGGILQDNEAN